MKLKSGELIPVTSELQEAISEARSALGGDSNDAEHDALVGLMAALGQEPEDIEEV